MEMRNFGYHLPITPSRSLRASEPRPSAADAAQRARSATDGDLTSRSASPELEDMISRLHELPATRAEMVEAARNRLAEGYYVTRSAAVQAAGAILEE
jgi:hypothetical protein